MSESAPPADSPLLSAARALLEELDLLFVERRRNTARIAHAKRLELHKVYGYASLSALAWQRYGYGKSKTSELIAISEESKHLPKTRAQFDAGVLEWTKAREITKGATPADEHEWLARAPRSTAAELRAARQGEPARVRRSLSFTPEQAARFDQALAGIQSGLNLADPGLAVLALLEGGGALGERAAPRVVISECGSCRAATTESREGAAAVASEVVDAARCAGEVHDLREAENAVTRAIPAKVRRRVLDRDRRRCLVPGCASFAFLEVHHERGWEAGHDPSWLVTLCEAHHRQRHEGWLLIEGQAPDSRFRLRSGAALGGEAFACAKGRGVGVTTEGRGEAFACAKGRGAVPATEAGDEAFAVAKLALRRLGLGARARRRLLEQVLRREGERVWSVEELLRAVLQRL